MLSKIFGNKKSNDISTLSIRKTPTTPAGPGEKQSRALKIIHVGGHVEHYYMATPAAMIIQKHHSFVLARPEIFRRPWDSVVRPEEILVPGQKYYVVPRRTVKKLRRRIRKPSAMGPGSGLSLTESVSRSFSGILVKPGIKVKAQDRHVRFFGLETTKQKDGSGTIYDPSNKKSGDKIVKSSNERRARIEFAWEPALQSINE